MDNFDKIAVVVDWLDACRKRDLQALLDLYAEDGSVECGCGTRKLHRGRAELEAYWQPQLERLVPSAFGLEEILPMADGVELDYLNFDGKPVRVVFAFDAQGRIARMRCVPLAERP